MLRSSLILLSTLLLLFPVRGQDGATNGFWAWFAERSPDFSKIFSHANQVKKREDPAIKAENDEAYESIVSHLKQVHPRFSPFVGGQGENDRELIVTVFGRAELFPAVDQFVASAPEIPGWRVIALKPAMSPDPGSIIRTGTVEIPLDDSKFVYRESKTSPGKYDIAVYLKEGLDDKDEGAPGFARTLTIDFLGERLAGSILGEVVIVDLAKAPPNASPFVKIASIIGQTGSAN